MTKTKLGYIIVCFSASAENLSYLSAREATLSRKSSLAFLSNGSSPMYKSKIDLHKSLLFTLPTWFLSTDKQTKGRVLDTLRGQYISVAKRMESMLLATLSTWPGSRVKSMVELLGILNSSLNRLVKLQVASK